MGADRAVLVERGPTWTLWRWRRFWRGRRRRKGRYRPDGEAVGDDDNNQVGQILAAVLGWPQATFASKIEFAAENRKANVTREVDGGLETIEVGLRRRDHGLRLNEPRYASLPGS